MTVMQRCLWLGLVACSAPTHRAAITPTTTTEPAAPSGDAASPTVATAVEAPVPVGACGAQTLLIGAPVISAIAGVAGDVAAGDVNGDGNVDVVLGGFDANGVGQVSVLFGRGDGTFFPAVRYPMLAGDEPRSIALTDFDNDNDLDIITTGGAGTPEVFLNNSDGSFGLSQALAGTPHVNSTRVVRAGDLDGDKDSDIAELSGRQLTVWFQSAGKFVPADVPGLDALDQPRGLAIADFDRDGVADLAIAGRDHGEAAIAVVRGSRRGKFAAPQRSRGGAVPGTAVAVVTGDFDGNRTLDVAALFAEATTGTIVVWSGRGDGTFTATARLEVAAIDADVSLVAADLEPDGRADLLATTTRGLAIYRSNGKGFEPAVLVSATDVRAITAADLGGTHVLGLIGLQPGRGAVVWPSTCR